MTYFSRRMRAKKRLLYSVILIVIAIGMMACGEKVSNENTEVTNKSEIAQTGYEKRSVIPVEATLTPTVTPDTEQASKVVTGDVGEEGEEQIQTLIADFTKAAKNKDYNSILPYYAIENYVSGYNMELAKEAFGDRAIQPTVEDRTHEAATRYTLFVFGFAAEALQRAGMEPLNAENLNEIAEDINLTDLTVKRIDIPMEEELTSDMYRKMLNKQCNEYGAENIAYRTVLYELDGDTYYCGFTLYCYGGTWEIGDLACRLVAVDATMVTTPCNEEEYLTLIEE